MAYDSVRAQLDKLLGPDRNGPLTAASATPTDYRHPDICKNYLLGFCPDDLHIKHRSEPGSCRRRHSDAARASFEKDISAFKANREKARWTASLLAECRAIVADEDRKIRCHARRLKDTYSAQGDLAGLMIQSFDTLKKLGMVSQNAKIRVLSENDDDEMLADPASDEVVEQEEDQSRETKKVHGESNRSALPSRGQDQTKSPQPTENDQRPANQSNSSNKKDVTETDDEDHEDDHTDEDASDGDDDDDDFGLIKVIPAVNNTSQDPGPLPKSSNGPSAQTRGSTPSSGTDGLDKSAAKDSSNTLNKEVDNQLESANSSARKPRDSTEKSSETDLIKGKAPETSEGQGNESERCSDDRNGERHSGQSKATPGNGTDRLEGDKAVKNSPRDDDEKKENTSDVVRSVPSMEEYYERGMGPDGLLMLDRKQSLRVCACCGGYISLVDAESRLLSHYGGKTHHSLAQLRKKVVELEAVACAEPVRRNSASQSHGRDRSEGQDRVWSYRDNERRYSRDRYGKAPERYQDRHGSGNGARFDDRRRVRSRRDGRGFGTSEWYNNYVYENGDRYSQRPGNGLNPHDRHSQRYSSGRKRYRSRSPVRDFRRARRHY